MRRVSEVDQAADWGRAGWVMNDRVDKHGELGFECAEVYTLYGKAVLNLAVTKSAVLGGGAPDKKDDKPELAGQLNWISPRNLSYNH